MLWMVLKAAPLIEAFGRFDRVARGVYAGNVVEYV